MANKREYIIEVKGVKEAFEDVKSLRDTLDALTDKVIKVSADTDALADVVKKEGDEVKKATETHKEKKDTLDALGKAQQKLSDFDVEYQTQLAKVNAELSSHKKEITQTLQIQQAQETVDAKQLESYADKQKYLTALNKLIRTHKDVTAEDKAEISAMVQESAKLQQELKDWDAEMKIYARNVGNYNEAANIVVESQRNLKAELAEVKNQMAQMIADGVSKTDKAFLELAKKAGTLKDAIADANDEIANFADDTKTMSDVINVAQTATNAWQLYNSALETFGITEGDAGEAMKQMMAIMTLLNSLQNIQNTLLANGSASAKIYEAVTSALAKMLGLKKAATEADTSATEANEAATAAATAATEANTAAEEINTTTTGANTTAEGANTAANTANAASTGARTAATAANTTATAANTTATTATTAATAGMTIAQKAATVATKALSVAIRSIPLMFVIGLVISLIQYWQDIVGWFTKTFPILGKLGDAFKKLGGVVNTIKAVFKGFGEAVINWLVNPIKTFANVISKLFQGDFKGAVDAAVSGIKNQFVGTAKAFKDGFQSQVEDGLEEIRKKAAAEGAKTTEQELEELKIRERHNKTYSQKYIDTQKKLFEQRKQAAAGNAEELNKIKLEEMKFDADVEDKKTAYAKEQQQERTAAAKKASDAAKKHAEEVLKQIQELVKASKDLGKEIEKLSDDLQKKVWENTENELKKRQDYYGKLAANAAAYSKLAEAQEKRLSSFYNAELNSRQVWGKRYMAERQKLVIEQFDDEIKRLKKHYQQIIDNGKILAVSLRRQLQTATGAQKEQIETTLAQVVKDVQNAEKLLKQDLGKFADQEINMDIDMDAIFDGYREAENLSKLWGTEMQTNIDEVLQTAMFGIRHFVKTTDDAGNQVERIANDMGLSLDSMVLAWADEAEEQNLNVQTYVKETAMNWVKQMGTALGKSQDDIYKLTNSFLGVETSWLEIADIIANSNLFDGVLSNAGEAGVAVEEKLKKVADDYNKYVTDIQNTSFEKMRKEAEDTIKINDDFIKKFQDAAKGIKFEPVKVDDTFSEIFDGQIVSLEKTRERYAQLVDAYQAYVNSVKKGSPEMQKIEDAWNDKLAATKAQYGEDSKEYRDVQKEKENAFKTYEAAELQGTELLEKAQKKLKNAHKEYLDSLGERIGDVYDAISENVFQPLADGFGALLDFQLEEAQEKLDEVEELLDEATELREESTNRIQELNEQIKNSDTGNKENLKQQLADEQVLLVQREQKERELQKEKEKQEAIIKKKEKQARKLELSQKLIEGIVNTALGVTSALKYGPILGPIFAAIIGAMGALQTGIIIKQMSKLERGGQIKNSGVVEDPVTHRGKTHRQGGHRIEGTNIEVEYGEYVVATKPTRKYKNIIEAINADDEAAIYRQVVEKYGDKYANELYNKTDSTSETTTTNETDNSTISSVNEKTLTETAETLYDYFFNGGKAESIVATEDSHNVSNTTSGNSYATEDSHNLYRYSTMASEVINNAYDSRSFIDSRQYREVTNSIVNNYYNSVNNSYGSSKTLVSRTLNKYAQGGQLDYAGVSQSIEQQSGTARITEAMNNIEFNPVVAVTDIEKKQKNLTKVRDLAGK